MRVAVRGIGELLMAQAPIAPIVAPNECELQWFQSRKHERLRAREKDKKELPQALISTYGSS